MTKIYPLQHPISKTPEHKPFEYDEALYKSDKYYPDKLFDIINLGLLRKHNLYQITVIPIQYNPVQAKLKVYTNITFRINFNTDKSSSMQSEIRKYQSQLFNKAVGSVSFNKEFSKEMSTLVTTEAPGGFLIIAHDDFYSTIQSFATHKENKGHEVTVIKKSDIPDQTANGIRNYIINAYNNWDPPVENVLLVGDAAYIPEFTGEYSGTASDLKYSLMDDDWLPDVFVGRFSVENTTQLSNIINKEITYENENWSTYDWTKKAVFMASNDNYTISEGTHNYVISNYLEPEGYTSDKLYVHTYSATTTQVINAFNSGRIYGVYSGHGLQTSWADGPPLSQSQIRSLTNGYKLPIVFSFACLTGQFNYSSECFGETWLRESNKGAIGFWGSSRNTQWDPDDWLERYLFSSIYDEIKTSFGGMTVEAKIKFLDVYPISTFTAKDYFEKYNILGDPTLNYPYLYNYACSNKSASYYASGYNNNHTLERGYFGRLHEVFHSSGEIFYRRSSNNGSTWEITTRLSGGNGANEVPSIAAGYGNNSDILCVVWQRKIDNYNYQIYSRFSTDMGTTWLSAPTPISVVVSYNQSNGNSGPGSTPVVGTFFMADQKEQQAIY